MTHHLKLIQRTHTILHGILLIRRKIELLSHHGRIALAHDVIQHRRVEIASLGRLDLSVRLWVVGDEAIIWMQSGSWRRGCGWRRAV